MIPAPTGAERQRIDWLADRLEGIPGERAVDDAGNLVCRFGGGRPQLLVMAHVDTVFGPRLGSISGGTAGIWLGRASGTMPPR